MPELIAKSPLGGRLPLTLAGCTLSEGAPGAITSVAPYPGQVQPASAALAPLGLTFPGPNGSSRSNGARLLWAGRDLAFLIGAAAPEGLAAHAALTDQTDGWCQLTLTGAPAAEALMRLVPLDLRASAFPPGRSVRAPLNHMSMILHRTEAGFDLYVFRSMARTAWHEIEETLAMLAARQALPLA